MGETNKRHENENAGKIIKDQDHNQENISDKKPQHNGGRG